MIYPTLQELGDYQDNNVQFFIYLVEPLELLDTQYDVFSFNFAGYSGAFVFDENFQPRLIKQTDEFKIDFSNDIFIITTKDGINYHFEAREESYTENRCEGNTTPSRDPYQWRTTAWYLTKIDDHRNSEILISYTTTSYTREVNRSESIAVMTNYSVGVGCDIEFDPPQVRQSDCWVDQHVTGKRVQEITNNRNGMKINFSYDYTPSGYEEQLNSISFTDNQNNVYKKVLLNTTEEMSPHNASAEDVEYKYWLFLDGIDIQDGQNQTNQSYGFDYDRPDMMPVRLSPAQDVYGHYNGQNSQVSRLPEPDGMYLKDLFEPWLADQYRSSGI